VRVGELEALVRESGMRTVLLEDTVADTQVSLMGAKQELIEVRKQLAVSEANQGSSMSVEEDRSLQADMKALSQIIQAIAISAQEAKAEKREAQALRMEILGHAAATHRWGDTGLSQAHHEEVHCDDVVADETRLACLELEGSHKEELWEEESRARTMAEAFEREREEAKAKMAQYMPRLPPQCEDPSLPFSEWIDSYLVAVEYECDDRIREAARVASCNGNAASVEGLGEVNRAMELELQNVLRDLELQGAATLRDDRALHLQCSQIKSQLRKATTALERQSKSERAEREEAEASLRLAFVQLEQARLEPRGPAAAGLLGGGNGQAQVDLMHTLKELEVELSRSGGGRHKGMLYGGPADVATQKEIAAARSALRHIKEHEGTQQDTPTEGSAALRLAMAMITALLGQVEDKITRQTGQVVEITTELVTAPRTNTSKRADCEHHPGPQTVPAASPPPNRCTGDLEKEISGLIAEVEGIRGSL